jgi:hypothetical protein
MKTKILFIAAWVVLCSLPLRAQFPVIDPVNIATSIANATKEIVQTSSTAANMLSNFKEVQKVYNQAKDYYDALKKVNDLVKDARKVQQTILMVGEIADLYVVSFQQMLADPSFTVDELSSIAGGYTILLEQSGHVLTELKNVVNDSGLSMNDKERMDIIDKCYQAVLENRNLVRYYTNKNIGVSYLRAKKRNDTERVLQLYGNPADRYY